MTVRRPMPQRRRSETFKIRHGGQNAAYHITAGYYHPHGEIGEVFISTNSVGSALDAMARDLAILMSLALQHGCSMRTMRAALTREADGTPSTIAGAVADLISKDGLDHA
jgi:hypothetical protein